MIVSMIPLFPCVFEVGPPTRVGKIFARYGESAKKKFLWLLKVSVTIFTRTDITFDGQGNNQMFVFINFIVEMELARLKGRDQQHTYSNFDRFKK